MNITDVRIRKVNTEGTLKADATITLDNEIAIHGIKVIEGKSGLFISMPSRKGKDADGKDKYFDVVHPVTSEARKALEDAIIGAYTATAGEA